MKIIPVTGSDASCISDSFMQFGDTSLLRDIGTLHAYKEVYWRSKRFTLRQCLERFMRLGMFHAASSASLLTIVANCMQLGTVRCI